MIEEDGEQMWQKYSFNANKLFGLVQFNVECMKWMFGNIWATAKVHDAPILTVGYGFPHELNDWWDDANNAGIGFYFSSYINLWSVNAKYIAAIKGCTVNFLELVDGAEMNELITCQYRYTDRWTATSTSDAIDAVGWNYKKWFDF